MNALVNDRVFWHLQQVAPERNAPGFSSQRFNRGSHLRSYQASSQLNEITGGDLASVPTHMATISRAAGRWYQARADRMRESLNSFKSAQSAQSEVNMVEVELQATDL